MNPVQALAVNPVNPPKQWRYKRGTNGQSRYKRKNDRARNNGDFFETPLDTRRGTPKTLMGTNGDTNDQSRYKRKNDGGTNVVQTVGPGTNEKTTEVQTK